MGGGGCWVVQKKKWERIMTLRLSMMGEMGEGVRKVSREGSVALDSP